MLCSSLRNHLSLLLAAVPATHCLGWPSAVDKMQGHELLQHGLLVSSAPMSCPRLVSLVMDCRGCMDDTLDPRAQAQSIDPLLTKGHSSCSAAG